MLTLTPDQQKAVDFAVERLLAGEKISTIGGYAGTGKTTIMGEIVNQIREKRKGCSFAFACYTGKAKDVLTKKLVAAKALTSADFCGTLHSLLYNPFQNCDERKDERTKKKLYTLSIGFSLKTIDEFPYSFIIIDEASMMDETIFKDLCSLGKPILAVGDHGQLPPVMGRFNLMAEPMIRLEKIHRQAENNPIIKLSMIARETGEIPVGQYGPLVKKTMDGSIVSSIIGLEEWMIICGTNKKRCRINRYVRERRYWIAPEIPQPGEKVICLQNNHSEKIFNGMIGKVVSVRIKDFHWYDAKIDMGDFVYEGTIFRHQFGYSKTLKESIPQAIDIHPEDYEDLFDYGYCLTAHKSQGSEAEKVIVYEEEAMRFMQKKLHGDEGWSRWLYTAVTRAKEQLIIIGE